MLSVDHAGRRLVHDLPWIHASHFAQPREAGIDRIRMCASTVLCSELLTPPRSCLVLSFLVCFGKEGEGSDSCQQKVNRNCESRTNEIENVRPCLLFSLFVILLISDRSIRTKENRKRVCACWESSANCSMCRHHPTDDGRTDRDARIQASNSHIHKCYRNETLQPIFSASFEFAAHQTYVAGLGAGDFSNLLRFPCYVRYVIKRDSWEQTVACGMRGFRVKTKVKNCDLSESKSKSKSKKGPFWM